MLWQNFCAKDLNASFILTPQFFSVTEENIWWRTPGYNDLTYVTSGVEVIICVFLCVDISEAKCDCCE